MGLRSELVPAQEADRELVESLFALMDRYYGNVTRESFLRDLREKDWIIVLRDEETGALAGFSTQMLQDCPFEGANHAVVFSGDTLIDPAHWGSLELQLAFARLLLEIHRGLMGRRLFWFLISKGFRTYRILPLYFRRFHPCHAQPTPPWEQRLLDHLARTRFPGAYDAETGILDFGPGAQYLKPPLDQVPEHKLDVNPHIRYFARRNPGHMLGKELACLAEFTPENLTPFIVTRLGLESALKDRSRRPRRSAPIG